MDNVSEKSQFLLISSLFRQKFSKIINNDKINENGSQLTVEFYNINCESLM